MKPTHTTLIGFFNVCSLCLAVAALIGGVRAYRLLHSSERLGVPAADTASIDISQIPHLKGRRTVVIGLATDCGLCRLEARFYNLIAERAGHSMNVAWGFPRSTSTAEAIAYLKSIGGDSRLPIAPLAGTNSLTVLLLDENDHLVQSWPGMLKADAQSDVLAALGLDSLPETPVASLAINPQRLYSIASTDTQTTVIDIRSREEFRQGHITNAINLPDSELAARIYAEAASPAENRTIVLYCHHCEQCEVNNPGIIPRSCRSASSVLKRMNFSRFYVMDSDLHSVSAAGVDVTGSTEDIPKQALFWSERKRVGEKAYAPN